MTKLDKTHKHLKVSEMGMPGNMNPQNGYIWAQYIKKNKHIDV